VRGQVRPRWNGRPLRVGYGWGGGRQHYRLLTDPRGEPCTVGCGCPGGGSRMGGSACAPPWLSGRRTACSFRTLVHARGCRREKNKPMCRDTHHLYNRPALSVSTVTVTHPSVGALVVQGGGHPISLMAGCAETDLWNPPSGCHTQTPDRVGMYGSTWRCTDASILTSEREALWASVPCSTQRPGQWNMQHLRSGDRLTLVARCEADQRAADRC
jgi:hypothetical protein